MERRFFVRTLFFASGAIALKPIDLSGTHMGDKPITLSMIYNNTGKAPRLQREWGLSIWVEMEEGAILFDTGGNTEVLLSNLKAMGFDPNKLIKVVISHKHWDHLGGLSALTGRPSGFPAIYVVESDLAKVKKDHPDERIYGVSSPQQIGKQLWSTGELRGGGMVEQSMVLVQEDALVLLTGCSHSGIVEMTEKVHQLFPDKRIALIAGGFHLMRKSQADIQDISRKLMSLKVSKIAPSHCTGDLALATFKEHWGDRFISFDLGDELTGVHPLRLSHANQPGSGRSSDPYAWI
jgi:7,8-dihydropterin-6-yl-methyl-4-(beta-D-ribofuranosyl)aminobenzene 5'-phosphate synthase